MFIKLKKNRLRKIIHLALRKSGDIRKLERKIKIPRSTLSAYHQEIRLIKEENLKRILDYLKLNIEKTDILEKFPSNWRQVKGGKKAIKIRKVNGTFESQMLKCHKGSSRYMKLWHKKMKIFNPEKYYQSQFKRFVKVGEYKLKTNNGEKVRNSLEMDTANTLKKLKIGYKYEPLVRIKNRYFFPDFLINNKIIVECTMWRGTDKAIKLKNKIKQLEKKYIVYVLIPKALNNYYKILNKHLILGLDEFVPVAQTFRDAK